MDDVVDRPASALTVGGRPASSASREPQSPPAWMQGRALSLLRHPAELAASGPSPSGHLGSPAAVTSPSFLPSPTVPELRSPTSALSKAAQGLAGHAPLAGGDASRLPVRPASASPPHHYPQSRQLHAHLLPTVLAFGGAYGATHPDAPQHVHEQNGPGVSIPCASAAPFTRHDRVG